MSNGKPKKVVVKVVKKNGNGQKMRMRHGQNGKPETALGKYGSELKKMTKDL